MTRTVKTAVLWALAGGFAFWLPLVLLGAIDRTTVDPGLLAMNLWPVAGLLLLSGIAWARRGIRRRWGWVLAGIYALGPSMMLLTAALTTAPAPRLPGDWLIELFICLFPPMTLWLAVLSGSIFSVLLATALVSLFWWLSRRREAV